MNKIKEFIQRIKGFFQENPQRAKLIGIIVVLAIIPLTIVAALTVQNLTQHAGGGTIVRISDQSGNTLSSTSSTNVFIDIDLNASTNWVLPNQPSAFNIESGLVKKAYAADSSCTPPYSGYLGCFTSDAFPSGSICTGSCTTAEGQDGQFCYTSTNVGNTCTSDSGLLGTCNSQGTCVASAVPPTSIPIPTDTPIQIDVPTTIPSAAPTSEPIPTTSIPISPNASTPTPAPNILRAIYIENKDTDGSIGGSAPIKITVNSGADIARIAWRLNDLLPGQTQAPRIVQVTFIGDTETVPFVATVNLIKPTSPTNIFSTAEVSLDCPEQVQVGKECHMSALAYDTASFPIFTGVNYMWGISSSNSIGTLNTTNGNITSFYAQNVGMGSIWVLVQQGNTQVQKSINIQVIKLQRLIH